MPPADPIPELLDFVLAGLSRCGDALAGATMDNAGLLTGLFLVGLVGSASHCVGMCGPFVLQQAALRGEKVPAHDMTELHRLTGVLLIPYHLGRIATYAALGALAGGLFGSVISLSGQRWIAAVLFGIAAFLLAMMAAGRIGLVRRRLLAAAPVWAGPVAERATRLFSNPVGWRGFALGLMLGFIPCGLLYAALMAAGAAGDPLLGGLAMAAFALGTVPALLVVGIVGRLAWRRWQPHLAPVLPLLLLANAGVLGYLAWSSLS
ncbi:sulfite exporter TauE/SafE family protein [Oceanibaculum pacificum]|uniref:Urease accessory protein UreH-like transmembrane domain-containing protein n=1 Tax=Oceanibaculum pacificum TaxID=580166 RepID=A0A154VX18_9PROT|nr:sulfite exporter TauE/SafE family protein [Oceanibaculum pacificum]KZD05830.1 hypothetical protein AUP43_02655 [Oceanibaculum pacificum]